jgi:curved DNA-binding protein CbpA
MYRKCTFKVLSLTTATSPTRFINGTVLDTPTMRHGSLSQPRWHRAKSISTWRVKDSPTPYEVMEMHPGSQYDKLRFYSLVKLYHPDSAASLSSDNLTKEERLDRYRLIVDANLVLSDDMKRSVCDEYGLGWSLKSSIRPEMSMFHGSYRGRHGYPGSPAVSMDEEIIWRLLFRNSRFQCLLLVVFSFAQVCLFISLVTQVQMETQRTDQLSQKLLHRHQDRALSTKSFMAQSERLLLKRDPSGLGVAPFEEALYREMLPYCFFNV